MHHLLPSRPRGGTSAANRLARVGRAALAGAMCFASASAMATTRCPDLPTQASFEVTALKTELMVVALSCGDSERYNAFINRYRGPLTEANNGVERHFTRLMPGNPGKRLMDGYVTSLANGRQQGASVLGSNFCQRNRLMFEEVMALPTTTDLSAYAAGKDLIPNNLGACPGGHSASPAAAPRSRGR